MKAACVIAVAALLFGTSAMAETLVREDPRDISVAVKGGIGDYTGALAGSLNAGPVWGVTLGMQPWQMLGFELGYDGSLNPLNGSGVVTRNGVSAMLKVSPPFMMRVKPFVGAGLGASVVSEPNGGSGYGGGLMEEAPLAAGIEFNTRSFTAGVRATYRILAGDDFARNGNFLDAAATIGGWF